jgi:endonuclease/exonuclease/phosphatase (EEP) superfamily protein YafD
MQEFMINERAVPKFALKHSYIGRKSGITLAIYSNYPILNKGEIKYEVTQGGYGKFIYADVLRGSDTLRVINVHLMSIRLEDRDLSTIGNLSTVDEEKLKQSGLNIINRIRAAAPVRGAQVSAIADFIALSPYPVILCGDLNTTPTTYAYRKLTQRLSDSFIMAGTGFGTTHPKFYRRNLPLRIDHVLAHPNLKALRWRTIQSDLSDHYPVVVDYAVPIAK